MADGWGPPADTAQETKVASSEGWGPPAVTPAADTQEKEPDDLGPMPGPVASLLAGVKQGIGSVKQSAQAVQGQIPEQDTEKPSPAASSFELRDILEPSRGLSKLSYQIGQSSPTIAGGVLGGLGGGAAGTAVAGPPGTAVGAIGGGALGSAAGAALQTLGPVFSNELKRTPNDPDGAWNRAVESAAISGTFSGAAWAAFPMRFFQGPVKNLAFQALGVQPGISVAERAVHNVAEGQPLTEGLGEAYKQGAIGTAVPALGHLALRGKMGEPQTVDPNLTPQQIQAQAADKVQKALDLHVQSLDPNISPGMAKSLRDKSNALTVDANFDLDRANAPARMQAKLQAADQAEQAANQPNQHPMIKDAYEAQARALRRDADMDGFISNLPPPLPVRTGRLGRLRQSYIDNVQPELNSDASLRTEPTFAMYKSKGAQASDALIAQGETYYYKWNKLPEQDRIDFMSAMETGAPPPPDLVRRAPWVTGVAKEYRAQLDMDHRLETNMGSKAAYLANYFPHIWKDPDAARKVFEPTRMLQSMGPKWFQKARTYDLIQHGLDNGLELKSTNPQDIITNRRLASVDMVNKMDLLHTLQRQGVAVPETMAPPQVLNHRLSGGPSPWEKVTAPNGEQWMIAPDITALWKNAVEAKGLWANEGYAGDAFRNWMKLKSAWVPIKLGLSLFHPVHVAHINFVNNMNRAIGETFGSGQQGLMRRFVAMPEAVLQTVGDTFFNGPPSGLPHPGKRMREAWLTPAERQTAEQRADVQLMNEAGISAQLSEQMRIAAKRDLSDAITNNRYLSSVPAVGRRAMEFISSPIFEKWIPNLKVAALKREAETLFRRRPDLLTNTEQRRVALRTIGKQIDNRFGEMFYGSLFWNRTLKDAAIGSFLSLGWNLGFAREFGGGAFEPIARRLMDAPSPTRKLIRDVSNKTTNMFMYSFTAMAINAMMNRAFTGENPNGLDYIFPRIGGLNPDGSPRRITNAFYTREVPMAAKNIEERQSVVDGLAQMMYHKMLFDPFIEMGKNKDYFGYQIYDENSPFYKQAQQFLSHIIGEQISPMSVAGAKRALQLSGKPSSTKDFMQQLIQGDRDAVLPMLGFGPAPAYASRSAIENRIQFLFQKLVAPEVRSFDTAEVAKKRSEARTAYLGAMQRGDRQAQIEAAKTLASLGVASKTIQKIEPGGGIQYMFTRLPALDQKALLKRMTAPEFKEFFPKASKAAKGDSDIIALARKYYAAN